MTTARTVVICLPAGTAVPDLLTQATSTLSRHGLAHAGATAHFAFTTRRTRALLQPWHGSAAGGPIRLLDLAGMRERAHSTAVVRWQLWRQIVTATTTARPFWSYIERHHTDPDRYTHARAQRDYLCQPRVAAMTAHNAVPAQRCPLPTNHVEALQAGPHAYATLAWLAAIPADAVCTAAGDWWTPTSDRLTDVLTYLHTANAHLDRAHRDSTVVALALTP